MLPSVCCLADARLVRLFPAVGRWGSSGLLAVLVAPAAETKKPHNRLLGCVAKRWLAPRKIHAFLNRGKVLQQGRCRQDKPRKKASLCPPHLPRKNDRNWRKSGVGLFPGNRPTRNVLSSLFSFLAVSLFKYARSHQMRKSPLDGSADELEKKAHKPPHPKQSPTNAAITVLAASLPHHGLPVFRFRSFATVGIIPAHERLDRAVGE